MDTFEVLVERARQINRTWALAVEREDNPATTHATRRYDEVVGQLLLLEEWEAA